MANPARKITTEALELVETTARRVREEIGRRKYWSGSDAWYAIRTIRGILDELEKSLAEHGVDE